ncbi:hypothetical protein KIPB_000227 [Kipferlia bialata]|uniref:BEACH domain-containing protein n=1 Tax=Kipferlia bialata TaxID=797122 RepID=A0A391NI01_9EUKA|nr:hypothetical protein KIPB_000227 [Kipferlia bialata]|eukprot:g227.t1
MFFSIAHSWRSVLTNRTDFKELIPAFYTGTGAWLRNTRSASFGERQGGTFVSDVTLPPWCHGDPSVFVSTNRAALESDIVSGQLHAWVDIVFGSKQRGPAAEAARNVFHPLTYEGNMDLRTLTDPVTRVGYRTQIAEFGQTPHQLFSECHPRRGSLMIRGDDGEAHVRPLSPPPSHAPTRERERERERENSTGYGEDSDLSPHRSGDAISRSRLRGLGIAMADDYSEEDLSVSDGGGMEWLGGMAGVDSDDVQRMMRQTEMEVQIEREARGHDSNQRERGREAVLPEYGDSISDSLDMEDSLSDSDPMSDADNTPSIASVAATAQPSTPAPPSETPSRPPRSLSPPPSTPLRPAVSDTPSSVTSPGQFWRDSKQRHKRHIHISGTATVFSRPVSVSAAGVRGGEYLCFGTMSGEAIIQADTAADSFTSKHRTLYEVAAEPVSEVCCLDDQHALVGTWDGVLAVLRVGEGTDPQIQQPLAKSNPHEEGGVSSLSAPLPNPLGEGKGGRKAYTYFLSAGFDGEVCLWRIQLYARRPSIERVASIRVPSHLVAFRLLPEAGREREKGADIRLVGGTGEGQAVVLTVGVKRGKYHSLSLSYSVDVCEKPLSDFTLVPSVPDMGTARSPLGPTGRMSGAPSVYSLYATVGDLAVIGTLVLAGESGSFSRTSCALLEGHMVSDFIAPSDPYDDAEVLLQWARRVGKGERCQVCVAPFAKTVSSTAEAQVVWEGPTVRVLANDYEEGELVIVAHALPKAKVSVVAWQW